MSFAVTKAFSFVFLVVFHPFGASTWQKIRPPPEDTDADACALC